MEDQNENISLEDEDIGVEEGKIEIKSTAGKNAIRGFLLLLAGPAVLLIPTLIDLAVRVPDILALFFALTAVILPGIGAVLCIAALIKHKELYGFEGALAIITILMCNPLFYSIYFELCFVGAKGFAHMTFM